jgi:hypothetical protein
MTIKHEAPHCATSSILLLLHPSLVQIFSLGPCSQTPSVYAFFLRTFLTAEVFLNHSGFLDHVQLTHTVGLLWTSDQPVAEAHRTTQQPSAGFEPATSETKLPQTYALDRAATEVSFYASYKIKLKLKKI